RTSVDSGDERIKFLRAERLGEKFSRAALARILLVTRFPRGGEHNDWNFAPLLTRSHMIEHIESAHLRHHQIENNEVGSVLALEYIERLLSVECERYSERSLLELDLDDS